MKNKIFKFTLSGDHDEDLFLTHKDMHEDNWAALMCCYHQGPCDSDVKNAEEFFDVRSIEKAKNYLISCGVEREKLNTFSSVKFYYLWILSGDIQEEIKNEK
jgi:hypothetical protein